MTTLAALILLSYLIGSVPVGLLLGKTLGVDVRTKGSANIGATNVSRLLGKKIGLLTLMGDALKAVLPMALAAWLLHGQQILETGVLLCGAAAFLGHLFPIYLKFRGGKGVATALGVFLYLKPLAVLLVVPIFAVIVVRWRYVSVASLAASAAMPAILYILGASEPTVLLATVIAAMIWFGHRTNIRRLRQGEESKWGES
jgi:glycerol-3-phosphate acyltransferase PlsY